MQRIYNILVSILGESKQGRYDKSIEQYQWNCKRCEEEKGYNSNSYNLETNFRLGRCHCWRCDYKGPISRIIKEWGSKELLNEYYRIVKELKESKFYNLELFKDDGTCDENGEILKLPETFNKIDLGFCRNKNLVEYLNKRGITQDLINYYNIGYTKWDGEEKSWRNRLIIPSYDSIGNLNYYVGRTFNEKDKRIRYRNCDADKKKIILNEDKIQWDADIVLVEGVIDAIYYPNTISLMGKVLTKDSLIFQKLYEKANGKIIIAIDGDTDINETKKIYNTLNIGRLKGKIKYIRLGTKELPWKDFGEVYENEGKKGIIKCLKSSKTFTEIELI